MQIRHQFDDDDSTATIYIEGLAEDLTILHLTDSHMVIGDERDPEASEHVDHFSQLFGERTPGNVPSREVFDQTIERIRSQSLDAAALTGDIIHFPAHAAIEHIEHGVETLGVPTLYTLGNHDWHFPHLPWSTETRAAYYPRFYGLTGGNPACQAIDIGGMRLITLDNSNYQVSPEQVEFLQQQLHSGLPCLLFIHIPLWIESLAPAVMAQWNAPIMMATQDGWTGEQRQRWKVPDNWQSTEACLNLLTAEDSSDNLAGIFCGHVHFPHIDAFRTERYQYVTKPGFEGGYRLIHLKTT
ncbi:MAG: metallophosphoesterase family protein [Candidatus Latescibacterota bacterium]|jgi:3',5'-cyclic AMP phosphodiesterase CpdA